MKRLKTTSRDVVAMNKDEASGNNLAYRLSLRFPGFRPGPEFSKVARQYPALVPDEFLDLVAEPSFKDPVFRQIMPDMEELDKGGDEDPAGETEFTAVPGLLHRYPDRALLITTDRCLVRCRHCMRKRLWSDRRETGTHRLSAWTGYVESNLEIKEIILSGGDPLALPDAELIEIMRALAMLPGERKLRIHSRALSVCPSRISPHMAQTMAARGVKRFVTQMNHPVEVTERARQAAIILQKAGIKVENQAVLLKGVNDTPGTLAMLFKKTADAGIRPYYLHHPDRAKGCMHFYLSLEEGAKIFQKAKKIAKTNVPAYVADLPGAGPKQEVLLLLE